MRERSCTSRTKRNLKGGTGVGCASEDCEGENRVGEGRGKGGLRRKVDKGTTREERGKKKTMEHEYNVPKVFKSTTNPYNILEEGG